LGVFSASLFGLAIPDKKDMDVNSFIVQGYWRWVWSVPLFTALLQILLLLIVLRSDTPVELKAQGKKEQLNALLMRIYSEN